PGGDIPPPPPPPPQCAGCVAASASVGRSGPTDTMTAVGKLVLLLGLLLAAHCDVRARDPEVEEEEAAAGESHGGGDGWDPAGGFGVGQHHPRGHGLERAVYRV